MADDQRLRGAAEEGAGCEQSVRASPPRHNHQGAAWSTGAVRGAIECRAGEAPDACECANCERVRAAERHESAARRLRAAGDHHRARLETTAAAAARIACAPHARRSLMPTGASVWLLTA